MNASWQKGVKLGEKMFLHEFWVHSQKRVMRTVENIKERKENH
jgi:hypothetical protein